MQKINDEAYPEMPSKFRTVICYAYKYEAILKLIRTMLDRFDVASIKKDAKSKLPEIVLKAVYKEDYKYPTTFDNGLHGFSCTTVVISEDPDSYVPLFKRHGEPGLCVPQYIFVLKPEYKGGVVDQEPIYFAPTPEYVENGSCILAPKNQLSFQMRSTPIAVGRTSNKNSETESFFGQDFCVFYPKILSPEKALQRFNEKKQQILGFTNNSSLWEDEASSYNLNFLKNNSRILENLVKKITKKEEEKVKHVQEANENMQSDIFEKLIVVREDLPRRDAENFKKMFENRPEMYRPPHELEVIDHQQHMIQLFGLLERLLEELENLQKRVLECLQKLYCPVLALMQEASCNLQVESQFASWQMLNEIAAMENSIYGHRNEYEGEINLQVVHKFEFINDQQHGLFRPVPTSGSTCQNVSPILLLDT